MKEDLLHFIWGQNKLHGRQLTSTAKEALYVKAPGTLNKHAGPDFFNAQVEIENRLWAGNVEIHLKSSDWYAHHHETDPRYDNVILHVVWEDDLSIFRKDGSQIPTLELKDHVPVSLLKGYQALLNKGSSKFINCEKHFGEMDSFMQEQWYDRLYVERLENKSEVIQEHLKYTKNDWEAVLFVLMARSFGSKINGELFMNRARQLDFSIVRKIKDDLLTLESLLFGYFGLLSEPDCTDTYYIQLREEYQYLARKFDLSSMAELPRFYGLRPAGFPTLRLSQLANLYHRKEGIFSTLMKAGNFDDLHTLCAVKSSPYWDNHYTFGKVSRRSVKKTSQSFLDLLMINVLVPMRFCYDSYYGRDSSERLLEWAQELPAEKNTIVDGFKSLGAKTKNAFQSQAQIELYNNYCSKNKCLQCRLGAHLLNRNT